MALFKKDVLQSAEKLVRKGKIEAAIKEYKKVVAKSPGDTSTLNRVGDLYVRLRKHAHAVDYYMKTAERYALDGFYVKAIAVYKKVQRIDPGAIEVHGRLADLYAKQGLVNDARSHFSQLADHHLRNNDTPSAIVAYEKIIDLDQDNPTPLLRLADLYREDGQLSKSSGAYERIATMMIQRGQVDHAVQVYERALVVEADNLEFISQAVLKIRDAGGVERALDLIVKAEQKNPAASELRNLLAVPKRTPESVSGPESLAPIEDVAPGSMESAGESLVPPPPEVASQSTLEAGDEIELALDLAEDLTSEREESRPALVDPDSFAQRLALEPTTEAETSATPAEIHVPPEPFLLRSSTTDASLAGTGGISSLHAPPPDSTPPDSTPLDSAPLDGSPVDGGETVAEETPDEVNDPALLSGEIDLGDLGDIAVEASQVHEPEDSDLLLGEIVSEQEQSDAGGAALDAAFDRQVDPGPIDLGTRLGGGSDVTEGDLTAEFAAVEESTEQADVASPAIEEKLSEASVFRKYGLLDKALDRLNEVLALVPDHLDALSQAIHVLVERGDEARASTKAETLHLLCAQRNERARWDEIRDLLLGEGYQIEEDRVRTPSELAVSSGLLEETPTHDPYDDASAEEADIEREASTPDFSALASEPLDLDQGQGHDMLDSKVFSLPSLETPSEAAESATVAESVDSTGKPHAELEVAPADEATPSWLDEKVPEESAEASDLFTEEEEFFDLASELQDEFGTGLSELEASLPENAAEQSLEEIVEGFKQGVAENISEEESDTHYNLGIAYREMMLLDEAVNEFQISAKSPEYLVESCAMLGLCFREKGLPDLAAKWYRRAVEAPLLQEEQRIGMLYELGDSLEAAGDPNGAAGMFTQVASMSAGYRDIEARLSGLANLVDG